MKEIKTINGKVLFSYNENTTTLAEEISKYKDLSGADLRWANLIGADLRGADLSYADLRKANLRWADLSSADLSGADLMDANLRDANLYNANLRGANLVFVTLSGADLSGADLSGANIRNATIQGAKNVPDGLPMACPEEGSFVAWKKVEGCYIIKLEIPEDAKRSSATSKKCRCDKAKVLEIIDWETGEKIDEVVNTNFASCTYKVGEMVYPDSFDDKRWNECSNGIHFFVNMDEAVYY